MDSLLFTVALTTGADGAATDVYNYVSIKFILQVSTQVYVRKYIMYVCTIPYTAQIFEVVQNYLVNQ